MSQLPKCPYCDHVLENMPTSTKKCKYCKNKIVLRTSPDKVKVLLNESDIDRIETEWDKIRSLKRIQKYEKQLSEQNDEYEKCLLRANIFIEKNNNDLAWNEYNKALNLGIQKDKQTLSGYDDYCFTVGAIEHACMFLESEKKYNELYYYYSLLLSFAYERHINENKYYREMNIGEPFDMFHKAYEQNISLLTDTEGFSIDKFKEYYEQMVKQTKSIYKLKYESELLWEEILNLIKARKKIEKEIKERANKRVERT